MLLLICAITLIITGLVELLLPKDKLVNKDKLKPGMTIDQVTKKIRISGVVMICGGILYLFYCFR